jgi:hypothetical protein
MAFNQIMEKSILPSVCISVLVCVCVFVYLNITMMHVCVHYNRNPNPSWRNTSVLLLPRPSIPLANTPASVYTMAGEDRGTWRPRAKVPSRSDWSEAPVQSPWPYDSHYWSRQWAMSLMYKCPTVRQDTSLLLLYGHSAALVVDTMLALLHYTATLCRAGEGNPGPGGPQALPVLDLAHLEDQVCCCTCGNPGTRLPTPAVDYYREVFLAKEALVSVGLPAKIQ